MKKKKQIFFSEKAQLRIFVMIFVYLKNKARQKKLFHCKKYASEKLIFLQLQCMETELLNRGAGINCIKS